MNILEPPVLSHMAGLLWQQLPTQLDTNHRACDMKFQRCPPSSSNTSQGSKSGLLPTGSNVAF